MTISSTLLIRYWYQVYCWKSDMVFARNTPDAESISAWSNQGSAMCLVSILNQKKLHGGNIYLCIQRIIQLEINLYIIAISKWKCNYFYWNYSGRVPWNRHTSAVWIRYILVETSIVKQITSIKHFIILNNIV